jgi:hypothetical protein
LLDFKFSWARVPYEDHKLQTQVYCLLADAMGLSTQELWYGIVLHRPLDYGQSAATRAAILQVFRANGTLADLSPLPGSKSRDIEAPSHRGSRRTASVAPGWKAFLFRYDPAAAAANLARALEYWRGEREAIPQTDKPRKCTACAMNAAGLCEHALRKPLRRTATEGPAVAWRDA